jgi:hypothetical protein
MQRASLNPAWIELNFYLPGEVSGMLRGAQVMRYADFLHLAYFPPSQASVIARSTSLQPGRISLIASSYVFSPISARQAV